MCREVCPFIAPLDFHYLFLLRYFLCMYVVSDLALGLHLVIGITWELSSCVYASKIRP